MLRIVLLSLALLLPVSAQSQVATPLGQQLLSSLQNLGLSSLQKQQLMRIAMDARLRQQVLRGEQQALMDSAQDALAAGSADLIALAAEQEALTNRRIAAARTTRDALLAFYIGLGPAQQIQIQAWLAQTLDRLDALHALANSVLPVDSF